MPAEGRRPPRRQAQRHRLPRCCPLPLNAVTATPAPSQCYHLPIPQSSPNNTNVVTGSSSLTTRRRVTVTLHCHSQRIRRTMPSVIGCHRLTVNGFHHQYQSPSQQLNNHCWSRRYGLMSPVGSSLGYRRHGQFEQLPPLLTSRQSVRSASAWPASPSPLPHATTQTTPGHHHRHGRLRRHTAPGVATSPTPSGR